MSTCTGPYVRVPFSHADLKPAENLIASIRGVGAPLLIREMPTGDGVADNFVLHVDVEDPSIPNCIWDIRAAKFQGPKKMFGRSHVYEIAVRKRNESNAVVWEGYRFTDKFEMLAEYFCADFANLLSGVTLKTWLPSTTAQEQRIQLCTGL